MEKIDYANMTHEEQLREVVLDPKSVVHFTNECVQYVAILADPTVLSLITNPSEFIKNEAKKTSTELENKSYCVIC